MNCPPACYAQIIRSRREFAMATAPLQTTTKNSAKAVRQFLTSTVLTCFAFILVSAIFAPLSHAKEATTTVYKRTMPDGSVSYSDQPSNSSKALEVSPIPTMPAFQTSSSFKRPPTKDKNTPPYDALSVSSPENNSAFYSGDGSMAINVLISPELKRNHMMEFILDGQVVATQKGNSLALTLVDRGTHGLQVNIIDSNGNIIQSTQSTFTIHRPIKRP